MLKNKLYISCSIFVVILLSQVKLMNAQFVGPDYYIQGTSIEIGVNGAGGFEGVNQSTSPPPSGYHARTAFLPFGFIADPLVDSWVKFDGDFYTPGSPENGWGIEIGTDAVNASNNYNLSGSGFSVPDIPGSITHASDVGGCISVDWEGTDTIGGTNLHIKINYFLQEPDLYYTTTVYITNNTSTVIPDMYYYRNLDPDNNVQLSGDFTTTNTIVSQPYDGTCNLAHVSATSVLPSTQPMSYIGLAGVGDNFRVCYGGFSNRDASDLWNATGFVGTVGSSEFDDEAIALTYRTQNLAPGATETFRYVTILASSGAAYAVNNLLHLNYLGATTLPPAACRADTARTCGAPIPIGVTGSSVGDFSWSWSPGTGLSSTTDPAVVANPGTTTSYTVTGTPISSCASVPVTILITVQVIPAGGPAPVIAAIPTLCEGNPPITLSVDIPGGTWGPSYVVDSTGTTISTMPGTYTVTYTTNAYCNNSDTATFVIFPAHVSIIQPPTLCIGSAPYTMLATAPSGVWSGLPITDSLLGTFDQNSVPGNTSYLISYTVAGVCPLHDTVMVQVDSTPVARINPIPDVCISAHSFNLTAYGPGGTWDGEGITNATFGTLHPSSAGAGFDTVTYTIDGPCGSVADTMVVRIVTVFNSTILTNASPCENDPPINLTAYTPGGVWSGLGVVDGTGGIFNPGVAGTGLHEINYTISGICGSSDTAQINVWPIPVADFAMAPGDVIAPGTDVSFYNSTSGGTSWLWNFGDSLSGGDNTSTLESPTHTYANVGTYCVLLTSTNANGCSDTTTHCILVTGESSIVVPNVFTPNGDGNNDVFYFQTLGIKDLKCTIYDRWGVQIIEFTGLGQSNGWKGDNKNGKAMADGTFFYLIDATSLEGDPVKQQGFVQLIREK